MMNRLILLGSLLSSFILADAPIQCRQPVESIEETVNELTDQLRVSCSATEDADVEKLIYQNVNYKSDAERIISDGLDDYQRENLVRDGKVGWYSSQLGLNALIDIFFLFIAIRYILPKL